MVTFLETLLTVLVGQLIHPFLPLLSFSKLFLSDFFVLVRRLSIFYVLAIVLRVFNIVNKGLLSILTI